MDKNRIFISFAKEDSWARDYLKGQAKNANSPFEFIDMSVKTRWDSSWKINCRIKIKGCDGVIALLSKNTVDADGARWEMKCAIEENIPIMGMYIDKEDRVIPTELKGKKVVSWSWPNISNFLESL